MAAVYADEDFSYPVVVALRRLGHDVLTAQEAGRGNLGITDAEVLTFASTLGRPVLTFNRRDFIRLHVAARPHAGILVGSRDDDTTGLADRVQTILEAHDDRS